MSIEARSCRSIRWLLTTGLIVGLCVLPAPATADRFGKHGISKGDPARAKIAGHLLEARKRAALGLTASDISRTLPDVRLRGDLVDIEIGCSTLPPAVMDAIIAIAGVQVTGVYPKYARLTARASLEALGELAAIPEVTSIHPRYGAELMVGATTSQADASVRADLARATFQVGGAGVKVGVLSDSFNDSIGGTVSGSGCNRTLTGSGPQLSGDLPPAVTLLDNGPGFGSDEGAATGELIVDLAPQVDVLFHTAFNSEADFALGITELKDCGAHVIVDDVLYYAEPMFQDGIIAQAAQDAVDSEVLYFSAAGNQGVYGVDEHYADVAPGFNDLAFPASGNDFHAFAADSSGADEFAAIDVPRRCGVRLVLQWNEPFSGTLGPGATTDLDLYVCTAQRADACGSWSASPQGNCAGASGFDPLEILTYDNDTARDQTIYVAVDHFCGPGGSSTAGDIHFRIATFGRFCDESTLTYEPGIFEKAQIYGHAAAAGVQATAAVFYQEIDSGGDVDPPPGQVDVEAFSSLGGELPFYFDGSGNPLPNAPATRDKPEIAAPDGTNTTFFGFDIEPDGYPNFFGTSAAAPHAAAVAALLISASPDVAAKGAMQVLAAAAQDIETPGPDPLSGHGLVDAWDTIQTVTASGQGCVPSLELSDQLIAGVQYFRACDHLTARDGFVVGTGAELTLESRGVIALRPGFSVEKGAALVARTGASFLE
jgi:subtilisin family serine protease